MQKSEYMSLLSALMDNVSADFIFTPSLPQKRTNINIKKPTIEQPVKLNTDVFYKAAKVLKKRTKNIPLLPSQYRPFIQNCNKCKGDIVNQYASIPETLPQSPYIMIVTDVELDERSIEYLSKILSSISLNISSTSDVYITPLAKCKGDCDGIYSSCFDNLVEEINLVAPASLLVFGKKASDLFRENGAESEVVWRASIPIILLDKLPLELSKDTALKKRLWDDLRRFRDYFVTL